MTELDWNSLPNFTRAEFQCRCGCGRADMDPAFMDLLQRLRTKCGFPFTISSGYRCPDHNASVSRTGRSGPHTTGGACDVRVSGDRAYRLLSEALALGLTGIGVSQKGRHGGRFIHLDSLPNGERQPRPWIWSY